MLEVEEVGRFTAGVDEVWAVAGEFVGFPEAMGIPVTSEGEGIGALRTVDLGNGPVTERLVERDEAAHRIVYAIVSGDVPMVGYVATMGFTGGDDGGTTLTWSGRFDVAPGGDETAAIDLVRAIYRGGIRGLQAGFGDPDRA